ncbi:hypothetical protein BDR06DRAFT_975405 [Suillus hirtellus]|nr:hypothetical protein BDR06DRAFT_975405 [Suillus hirtellus]
MAAYFLASPLGQANRQLIDHYCDHHVGKPECREAYRASAVMEHAPHAPKIRAVMVCRVQIIKGDVTSQVVQLVAQIFQAIVMGTIFYHLPDATSGYFSRGGILFFALFFGALSAMAEIPALYAQHLIVLHHHKAAMYYPFIKSLAHTVVDIPITFIIQGIFSVLLYFLVDLQRTAAQFFIFFLIVFTMTTAMKGFFRLVAAAFKEESSATSVAGIGVLVFSLYMGYTIPRLSIPGALRWITYLNPLGYSFESLMMNKFHTLNGTCSTLVPQGPGYENVSLANQVCTTVGAQPGMPTVNGNAFTYLSYDYKYSDLWHNYGVICAFGVSFLLLLLFTTKFNMESAFDSAVTLFKQSKGAGSVGPANVRRDAEKAGPSAPDEDEEKAGPSVPDEDTKQQRRVSDGKKKHALPDIFTWHHVQYVVPISGGPERKLLDDVSGYVAPGKLTALMGESGAGKTNKTVIDYSAQCPCPMDTHLPQATVREAILSSAHLRQSEFVPMEEIRAHVDKCVQMCGLKAYADAVVGTLGVEHKKCTTIAVELAAKVFMLGHHNIPLVHNLNLISIHQPSGELFQLFDRLLLLRKGGQTVYFGEIGERSSTMLKYFEHNGAIPCNEDANPTEYMLDVIGAGATANTSVDWHNTELRTQFATSWKHQTIALTQCNFQAYWQNPTYLMGKLVLNITGGLLIGFTFYNTKDSLQGTQNKLFMQAVYIDIWSIYKVWEHQSRMYKWTALITSQILVEIPWNIFCSDVTIQSECAFRTLNILANFWCQLGVVPVVSPRSLNTFANFWCHLGMAPAVVSSICTVPTSPAVVPTSLPPRLITLGIHMRTIEYQDDQLTLSWGPILQILTFGTMDEGNSCVSIFGESVAPVSKPALNFDMLFTDIMALAQPLALQMHPLGTQMLHLSKVSVYWAGAGMVQEETTHLQLCPNTLGRPMGQVLITDQKKIIYAVEEVTWAVRNFIETLRRSHASYRRPHKSERTTAMMMLVLCLYLRAQMVELKGSAETLTQAFDAKAAGKLFQDPRDDTTIPDERVFIMSWVDYCNKYGMGYALTDGSVDVHLNDTDKHHFDYISSRHHGPVYVSKNFSVTNGGPQKQDPEQAKFNQQLVDKFKYCKEVLTSIRNASARANQATTDDDAGMGGGLVSTKTSKASLW